MAWHGHLARDSSRHLMGKRTLFTGKMPVPRLKVSISQVAHGVYLQEVLLLKEYKLCHYNIEFEEKGGERTVSSDIAENSNHGASGCRFGIG